jgi:1-aminocyclopropane-1-carboxylate deaminase/D-cysteine desulfhydrase-like pyridoxal-dependent ACC family enzyme
MEPASGRDSGADRREALLAALANFPRIPLAMLPTPLVEAPRLSSALQGPAIWLKREDLAGLGLGGSKYRILEFTLGNAVASGADIVVASGVAQSNHPQQVVSAACHLGIPAVVLLGGAEGHVGWTGNMLLEGLSGAQVHVLPSAGFEELRVAQESLAERLRALGRRPALVTLTRDGHLRGVLAYVNYMIELVGQMEEQGLEPAALYVASGGPTYAGMVLGAMALGAPFDVIGVSPLGTAAACYRHVVGLIEEATQLLALDLPLDARRVRITDAYLGAGHGITTPAAVAAIKLTASTQGVFLDPVYSGKGMAALIDHIANGEWSPKQTVVFTQTGGVPALFAYAEELMPESYSVLEPGSLEEVAAAADQEERVRT